MLTFQHSTCSQKHLMLFFPFCLGLQQEWENSLRWPKKPKLNDFNVVFHNNYIIHILAHGGVSAPLPHPVVVEASGYTVFVYNHAVCFVSLHHKIDHKLPKVQISWTVIMNQGHNEMLQIAFVFLPFGSLAAVIHDATDQETTYNRQVHFRAHLHSMWGMWG